MIMNYRTQELTMNKKTITFIILITVLSACLWAQKSKSNVTVNDPLLYINHVDFSEYPKVSLFITASDQFGNPIDFNQLDNENILIHQNQQKMKILKKESLANLKDKGEEELYISLVLDNSYSMQSRIKFLDNAVQQFIKKTSPTDYLNIVDFEDQNFLRFDFLNHTNKSSIREDEYYLSQIKHIKHRIDFTNSKKLLLEAANTKKLTSMTYLYDGILTGLYKLQKYEEGGKKFLVIFSDGIDTNSNAKYQTILKFIKEYKIPIYAIDLGSRENKRLKEIAQVSGGDYFFTQTEKDLDKLYAKIFKILENQWKITCTPDTEQMFSNNLNYTLDIHNPYNISTKRNIQVKGDQIAYQSLMYNESQGKESEQAYLNFLSSWEKSNYYNKVMIKLGSFYARRGDQDKAFACYNIILRDNAAPEFSEALMKKGSLFNDNKNYAAASNLYKRALNNNYIESTTMAKVQMELAKTYAAEGEYSAALNSYSQLVSKYQGTEYAAEALISSAMLHMEMGDLTQANNKLNEVLSNYPESKSAVYAKIEKSKIDENPDNTNDKNLDNQQIYSDIITSRNLDADIKNEYTLKLAKSHVENKRYDEAYLLLDKLINDENALDEVRINASKLKIETAYAAGQAQKAGETFYNLSPEYQSILTQEKKIYPATVEGIPAVALCNGTIIRNADQSIQYEDIQSIEKTDDLDKFEVIGSYQKFSNKLLDSYVYFYIPQYMLENKTIIIGVSGVYQFIENQWEQVNSKFDTKKSAFMFECTSSGIYCVMARPPKVITLFNINFELNKADLTKDSEPHLFRIIDELKELPDVKLEIAGHTDNQGTEEFNQKLSEARANSVKSFIVKSGIDPSRISIIGYGFKMPIVPNDSPENMAKNRRTEFTITSSVFTQTFNKTEEKEKFAVYLSSFTSIKKAADEKKFYQKIGFKPRLIMDEENKTEPYKLYLAICSSQSEAESIVNQLIKEYKNLKPQVISIN